MAKKRKSFDEHREMTKQITTRFLAQAHEIIGLNKRSGGQYRTLRDFAKSVKSSSTMWSQYNDNEGRNVTLEMVAQMCRVHGVNGEWLLTGKGEKYYNADTSGKLETLEKRMQLLESKLIKAEAADEKAAAKASKAAARKK
jgi:hypothetical protein